MLKLPKINKTVGVGLTGIAKVKKVVLAAAVGLTLTVGSASAATLPNSHETGGISQSPNRQGALLLAPSAIVTQQLAAHYSHVSHYSHSSHQSHHSHYSSR
jgi:hypothetical protein